MKIGYNNCVNTALFSSLDIFCLFWKYCQTCTSNLNFIHVGNYSRFMQSFLATSATQIFPFGLGKKIHYIYSPCSHINNVTTNCIKTHMTGHLSDKFFLLIRSLRRFYRANSNQKLLN